MKSVTMNEGKSKSIFVKICGTTNEEDALLCLAMGADAIGFVFAPSVRQVTANHVSQIVRRLPADSLTIGVFKDESVEMIKATIQECSLKGVQIHGDLSPQEFSQVNDMVDFSIRAISATTTGQIFASRHYQADAILLDSNAPGSGQVFDWETVEGTDYGSKIIVAGGLNPHNVAQAIRILNPWGVDAVSGLEASPGRKDPRKVRAFVKNAREALP